MNLNQFRISKQLITNYHIITKDQSYKIEIISGNVFHEDNEYFSIAKLFDYNVR